MRSRFGAGISLLFGVTLSMYSTITRESNSTRLVIEDQRGNLAQRVDVRHIAVRVPRGVDFEVVLDLLFGQYDAGLCVHRDWSANRSASSVSQIEFQSIGESIIASGCTAFAALSRSGKIAGLTRNRMSSMTFHMLTALSPARWALCRRKSTHSRRAILRIRPDPSSPARWRSSG